jgi:hypothetical protein
MGYMEKPFELIYLLLVKVKKSKATPVTGREGP